MKRTIPALVGALALVALCLGAQLAPGSSAAYVAKVTNTTNTSATATFTCAAAYATDKGTAIFQYPLSESGVSSSPTIAQVSDISGNNRTGYYYPSLGAITTSTAAPTGCPRDTGGAWVLNGSSNFAVTPGTFVNPQTFSEEIWFKTTIAGGKLIGFGNSQNGSSGTFDRHIYLTSGGQLTFGVYNGGANTITSSAAYNNGLWHQVVATFSPGTGAILYVDGAVVASNPAFTVAETNTGYWKIGWDNLGGWPNPGNYYYSGQLRYAAVYSSVLSASQVLIHYNAGK